jgi:tRNA-guanine family transglycosylase
MNSDLQLQDVTEFEVKNTAGDARVGELLINGITMETPNIFPVINFYGGGRSDSVFGGSTHRTVKELINGDNRVDSVDCSHLFKGGMMSVGSLTDYGIHRDLLKSYLSTPIKRRPEFQGFEGILFADSGGYKNLTQGGLDGSDFEIDLNQARVFEMQKQLGGELIVNLDLPIEPDDTFDERCAKARETAKNANEFIEISKNYPAARYLTIHGYNYSMIDTFMTEIQEVLGDIDIASTFDGIALGSLVPKKDDRELLIDAVQGCRKVMSERGFGDLPLHVLGISNTAIPLLAAVGADTFDSSSYIQAAINGKYYESLLKTTRVDNADFTECDCPVCSSPELRSRMNGDTQYRKDQMGPAAVHNLHVQMNELEKMRHHITQKGKDGLIEYIESTIGRDDKTRKHAHRVVNESLGGYF